MKAKTTRRALLMSVLSLLLCVSMLVGTTFAWFTDSVTSGRNTILAGNLDVVLEYWDGNSYEEVTSATKLFDDAALWEPGYTDVAYLKVSNAGTLALKYHLAVDVFNEILGKTKTGADIKLSDYLQFKVVESDTDDLVGAYATREAAQAAPATATKLQTYNSEVKALETTGEADYVALIVYMPTTVGNEANHDGVNVPSIELGVNLLATQQTYEADSFDDQYDKDAVIARSAAEAQAALDNAGPNTMIQLVSGVDYGTLYLRPVKDSPATKEVDWVGNNYRYETYSRFENLTIIGAPEATVDAIKVEGGTYYNTEHSQSATYPIMLSLVELKNVVFDGVTFTGKGGYDPQGYGNAINLSGNNIKVDGLTLKNCVLDNESNNARLIYKTESTTAVHTYTYDGETYTFSPSLKDITVTGCTFNGGYMGLELRETENVTITNNVFNVADRNILLPVNNGCAYSGTITITGNTSNNAKERFVRASGMGNATVVITDNTILNYQGTDADYIKVTDSNGTPVIENNVVGRSVYGLTLIPNGENSKIIVNDKEGFLNLTKLFADWRELFTDGNGNEFNNYANGAGANYYYGGYWTISLEADIDLNNATIAPITINHPVSAGDPTFDGNNHTIKNAKIVADAAAENMTGLFNVSHEAFKNLKLDNIHVTGSNVGNSSAGILAGSCHGRIDNITITNSSVTGGKYTGGVVGYGYTDISNCTLTNVTVKGGYKLGGIIGYICASNGTGDVTGNTLTNCTVDGIGGGVFAGGKTEYVIGQVVGNYDCNGICNNNTVTNMTPSGTAAIGKIEAGKTVTQ